MSETLSNGGVRDELEMDGLNKDKRTRFQVNRVRNESHTSKDAVSLNLALNEGSEGDDQTDDEETDLQSVTDRTRLNSEYAKSFR